MNSMQILNDHELLKTYKKAIELHLDEDFIEQIEEELNRRELKWSVLTEKQEQE